MSLVKTPKSKDLVNRKFPSRFTSKRNEYSFHKRDVSRNVHYSFIHNNREHQPERINKLWNTFIMKYDSPIKRHKFLMPAQWMNQK